MPEIQNPKFQIPNLNWNLELETWNPREARFAQARIIHGFASRSGGSAGGSALRHVATETPAGVLLQYAEEVEGVQRSPDG